MILKHKKRFSVLTGALIATLVTSSALSNVKAYACRICDSPNVINRGQAQLPPTHGIYGYEIKITTSVLNVRSGPGTGYGKIGEVYNNEDVWLIVDNYNGDRKWLYISYHVGNTKQTKLGWVYKDYTSDKNHTD